VSDNVAGRLNGEVDERYRNSIDHLDGRIDDADAGHAELQPIVAGRLDLGVGQHGQQDVIDAVDLVVNVIDEQSSTHKARVQTYLLRCKTINCTSD